MEEGIDVLSESPGSLSSSRRELDEHSMTKTTEDVHIMDTEEQLSSEATAPESPTPSDSLLTDGPGVPEYEEDAIRCVCDSVDDDGFTIQCDSCLVWQHAICVGISKDAVPESYFCELCKPELHQKVQAPLFLRDANLFSVGRLLDQPCSLCDPQDNPEALLCREPCPAQLY